jgi:hypothetical protein
VTVTQYERRATDDLELTVLKFAAGGAAVGVFASLVGDVAAGIVLLGAVGLALEWLLRKIIRPMVRLIGTLEGLAPWMRAVDAWRGKVDEWRDEASGELAELKEQANQAASKSDVAAEASEAAATEASRAKEITTAIARHVGAKVRGVPPYPEDEK